MAIIGIKSVDFYLTATGEGVVNHNGSFPVWNPSAGKVVDNHMFPKLRGYDPMQRLSHETAAGEKGTKVMRLDDPALAQAQLIVSSECVRAEVFREVSFGLARVTPDNVTDVLASLHGLVRGYLITVPGGSFPRKSPLHVTDLCCENPQLAFNQGTNASARVVDGGETSIYSYFKTGKDLIYEGKASLSIEDLQFIPLENSLGRSAYDHQVSIATGHALAEKITAYLQALSPAGLQPAARFVKKAVRVGAVQQLGEAGILLNDDALRLLCAEVTELLQNLYIRQGKGYVQMQSVLVDYNTSGKVFRAAGGNTAVAESQPTQAFAQYYTEVDISDQDYEAQQAASAKALRELDKKNKSKGKSKKETATEDTQA